MQESTSSVYKRLTWLLLIVVIGLYALHVWHSGQLKDHVAGHKAALAEQRKANEAMAAEQRRAADAYAELQGRFDAGTQRIAALDAEVQGLNQAQMSAAAKYQADMEAAAQQHQAKLQEMAEQANARIADLNTALQGSDPERAALFEGFQQQLDASHQAIASLEATKAELGERLTVATATIEQKTQAVADLGREVESLQGTLTQTRGELAELQTRHDTAMDKATMDIAALNAKHDAAVDQAAKERADLEAGHAAALDQAAKDAAALQAKIEGDLAQAKATHADELGQANSRIQALADDLAALRAEDDALKVKLAEETAALTALKTEDEALKVQLANESAALAALKVQDDALMEKYKAETAAHAALQTKHDTMVADLNSKLADTEKALSGVKADLDTATKAAADQKTALEQQIDEAKGSIAGLEKTLATERTQNEEARTAADQASRAALAYQRSLYARFSDIGAKETEQGMLLRIAETEVQFPVSKATLPKGELPSLDRVASLLRDFPKLTARIEGHTDASGREETNLALSQARAEAIKEALVTRGIPAERIEATGIGEAKPIADNATKAGSRLNRRVEIYIVETPK
jgi:outer membrane protein OmpA-like peptidoglycan-associated protein